MRSDTDVKRDVEDELRWDPDLDATDIAVTVKSGVVTLAGFTRSYSDKLEAEAAAPAVAQLLAAELGWDAAREKSELASFSTEQRARRVAV